MSVQLFRPMRENPYDRKPLVMDSSRGLGPRPGEILENDDGMVEGGSQGISIALHTPENLHYTRKPKAMGGKGADPCWMIESDDLGELIVLREDPAKPDVHGFLEPSRPMTLQEYREALAETRDAWRRLD